MCLSFALLAQRHFDQKVVRKTENPDSITRTLSSQRIDGFLESLLEVLEIYATAGITSTNMSAEIK